MREDSPIQDVQVVLTGIANRARVSKTHRFGGLYTLLKEPYLKWSFRQLNRKVAGDDYTSALTTTTLPHGRRVLAS